MKHIPNIIGGLLGLLFVAFEPMVLLKLGPTPPAPPEGSPTAQFMGSFATTGYLTFVKVLEVLGGILVAMARTRNFGPLVLGSIVINILAFHIFVAKGEGLFNPVIIVIVALALFLLRSGRKEFGGLMRNRPTQTTP